MTSTLADFLKAVAQASSDRIVLTEEEQGHMSITPLTPGEHEVRVTGLGAATGNRITVVCSVRVEDGTGRPVMWVIDFGKPVTDEVLAVLRDLSPMRWRVGADGQIAEISSTLQSRLERTRS